MLHHQLKRAAGVAIRANRNEAVAITVEKWPECGAVAGRKGKVIDLGAGKETESPLINCRRQPRDWPVATEEEQEPVSLPLIGLFRNHPEEVKVDCRDLEAGLLARFPDRALKR